jgi:hypothetical protein
MGAGPQSWATWSDQTCRTVTVTFTTGDDSGPSSWKLEYDKPHQCGNYVMGLGECIGYSVHATDGNLQVQTIGLSGTDSDQLVHSIKI